MTFKLAINVDNDAFQPDPYAEVARLLRQIADRVERVEPSRNERYDNLGDYADGGWAGHYQTVLDVNGNDVGRYGFKREDN